jgi:dTDP-4-dehydrorhamnose reductase
LQKKKCIVFGATGFLGPHVLRELAGTPCLAVGRQEPAQELSFGASFASADGVATQAGCDLTYGAKAVVFLAAVSSMGEAERDPARAFRLNAEWPAEVASYCSSAEVPFLYVSTDLVFGGRPPSRGQRYTESDTPSPVGVYGESKLRGEQLVMAANPEALIVRLPLLFGGSFGRGLGPEDGLIAAVKAGERPLLFSDEWRTALDVRDAARALVFLSENPERRGTLHVAGEERLTRADLGLRLLIRGGLSEAAARSSVRIATQTDAGLEGKRAKDASLDSGAARALFEGNGLELEVESLVPLSDG